MTYYSDMQADMEMGVDADMDGYDDPSEPHPEVVRCSRTPPPSRSPYMDGAADVLEDVDVDDETHSTGAHLEDSSLDDASPIDSLAPRVLHAALSPPVPLSPIPEVDTPMATHRSLPPPSYPAIAPASAIAITSPSDPAAVGDGGVIVAGTIQALLESQR